MDDAQFNNAKIRQVLNKKVKQALPHVHITIHFLLPRGGLDQVLFANAFAGAQRYLDKKRFEKQLCNLESFYVPCEPHLLAQQYQQEFDTHFASIPQSEAHVDDVQLHAAHDLYMTRQAHEMNHQGLIFNLSLSANAIWNEQGMVS